MNRRPQLTIVGWEGRGPSPEEAAAVVAAVERFMRDTAPVIVPAPEPTVTPWKRTALLEGIDRDPHGPRWG